MSCWVPSGLVIGGDQPFVRRLIGVSTSPLVGSIYNMGVWDKVVAPWVNVATWRTMDREEAARPRYKETGRSLGGGKLACAHGGSRMSISRNPPPFWPAVTGQ